MLEIKIKLRNVTFWGVLFFSLGAQANDPFKYTTQEYLNQIGLYQVGAHKAYDLGYTGKGVTIAVLDTGVNYYHPDLFTQVAKGGFDYYNGQFDYMDHNGHGTLVAGILAASKNDQGMHGLAYNSKVLSLKVTNNSGTFQTPDAVNWALQNAIESEIPIINYSASISTQDGRLINDYAVVAGTGFAYTALSDKIIVAAAGNKGDAHPIFPALLPYVKPENHDKGVYRFESDLITDRTKLDWSYSEGLIVAVASADRDGVISDFSNRCGAAAPWCITAPGEDILTTFWFDMYIQMKGTSIATPFVSGALALLKEAFPHLTPEQLVELILVSANKDGIYADESIYGQGFLDIENAFAPQGEVLISSPEYGISDISFTDSYIQGGGAIGNSLQTSLSSANIAVTDMFQRNYIVPLNTTVQNVRPLGLNNFEEIQFMNMASYTQTQKLSDSLSFSYTPFTKKDEYLEVEGDRDSEQFSNFAFSFNTGASKFRYSKGYTTFVNDDGVQATESLKQRLFQPSYLDMAVGGQAIAWQYELSDNLNLYSSWHDGANIIDSDLAAYAVTTQLHWSGDDNKSKVNFVTGYAVEEDSTLGMTTSGAFSLKSGSTTEFAGLNARYALTEDVSLLGSAYLGRTKAKAAQESLVSEFSNMLHHEASVAVEKKGVFNKKDRATIAFAAPLKVAQGGMKLNVLNVSGTGSNVVDINFTPEAQEQNIHLFYDMPIFKDKGHSGMQLTFSNNYRHIQGERSSSILYYAKLDF